MAPISMLVRKAILYRNLLLAKLSIVGNIFAKPKTFKRRYTKKKWWVHPIWRHRSTQGHYNTLVKAMARQDSSIYKRYLRMSPTRFVHLENLLGDKLKKTGYGIESLSTGLSLAVTQLCQFLATGDSYFSIACAFRIGITTVHNVIKETCVALWEVLQPIYLPSPTPNMWRKAADEYGRKWQFPLCCGAVDGKHIVIQQPAKSGSQYHNYKGTDSIVLMALVDAQYKFLAIDVVLHNYLLTEEFQPREEKVYCPVGFADFIDSIGNVHEGMWHENMDREPSLGLRNITPTMSRRCGIEAKDARKVFTASFNSKDGDVPWQWNLPEVVKNF